MTDSSTSHDPTNPEPLDGAGNRARNAPSETGKAKRWALWFAVEVLLIVGLFFLMCHGSPPGTNEPHYLCKAKNFWDSNFCAEDIFLDSADAHLLFYITIGWLTKFVSLPVAAWIGRLICWLGIAIGWRMLSYAVVSRPFYSVLSAGLAVTCIQHFHFAGEWLIGGVEAKGLAYAFLFAGLSYLVRGKWGPVWILFGISAAFHVLVGGWGVIAGMIAWLFCAGERGRLKVHLISLPIGFLCSLPGLLPALFLTVGQDSEIVAQANEIYTFERISHHLVFSHIRESNPARFDFFLVALVFWFAAALLHLKLPRFRNLNAFILATVAIASCALLIEWQAARTENIELATKLLRYYWFRLSDLFVPIGVAITGIVLVRQVFEKCYDAGAVMVSCLILIIVGQIGWMQYQQQLDQRPQADRLTLISFPGYAQQNRKFFRDWIDVCVWIRTSTENDARFITPRSQSTFKWYAQRSEVASWKDVPQDAAGVVNWSHRFKEVYSGATFNYGLASLDAERRLLKLAKEYQAEYLVIERRHVRNRKQYLENAIGFYHSNQLGETIFKDRNELKPLFFEQVYPNRDCDEATRRESSYLVYRIRIPDAYQERVAEIDRIMKAIQAWVEQEYGDGPEKSAD